jgi:hypothetical protein
MPLSVSLSRTTVLNRAPASLPNGQLALNNNNGRLFLNKSYETNVVIEAVTCETKIVTVSTTFKTTIDSFPLAAHKSAKYLLECNQGSEILLCELLVVHNNTSVSAKQTACYLTNTFNPIFGCEISSPRLLLTITNSNSVATTIKMLRTTMPQFE